ncbi:MAG: hypothetical protein ACRDQF_11735, partial [Thermocrispum sp.]
RRDHAHAAVVVGVAGLQPERKTAYSALARLFAAMLADENFLAAERRLQQRGQRPDARRKDQDGRLTPDAESS